MIHLIPRSEQEHLIAEIHARIEVTTEQASTILDCAENHVLAGTFPRPGTWGIAKSASPHQAAIYSILAAMKGSGGP